MFNLFRPKKVTTRQEKSEKILELNNIKINQNLPQIESEDEVALRTIRETAERVTILAITNLVAFSSIKANQAIEFLKRHNLSNCLTPKEHNFLSKPTEKSKSFETWKCEGIWTLLWALKIVDDLGFPDQLCDLSDVPEHKYPIVANQDPNQFINTANTMRSKAEILDANDLYYRFEWACVDARVNNQEIQGLHPRVVYERHYALNWLINYRNQDWDEISCDT